MRRIVYFLFALFVLMIGALPAFAGSVTSDSKCSADAIKGASFDADGGNLDAKSVATATSSDPFRVDLGGEVSWDASTTEPIKEHTWQIGLVIGGFEVAFFSGGDPNSAGTQTSTGITSVADQVEQLENTLVSWALDNLVGTYEVWGKLEGEGGKCQGTAWALIEGGPFSGLIGQASFGATIAGAGLLAGAAVKKKKL